VIDNAAEGFFAKLCSLEEVISLGLLRVERINQDRQVLLLSLCIRSTLLSPQKLAFIIVIVIVGIITTSSTTSAHAPSNRAFSISRSKPRISGARAHRIFSLTLALLLGLALPSSLFSAECTSKDTVRACAANASCETARHTSGIAGRTEAAPYGIKARRE
jgi:hypothetical protein